MKLRPDARTRLRRAALLAALPLAAAACAGPPITSPIDGEPVCPDFQVGAGHTKMAGSLRFPVQLIIKNGTSPVFKTTIVGLRTDKDLASRILLADDNESYTVEWGQCENERAPHASDTAGRDTKGITKYECGKAEVYKSETLNTRKGDPKSHALAFAAPPNAACWQSSAPPPEPPDAGAPDAAPATAGAGDDAGAPPAADAGADSGADSDAGATDAGATPAATSDAGASDAGAADAGKGASKSP